MATSDPRSQLNMAVWARAVPTRDYASRRLRPVEQRLLDDFRADLSGRVLELGCGGGRLTGHLLDIAQAVSAIDVSPEMVAYCQHHYPRGSFSQRDLRDLSEFEAASFDAVVAAYNVLDVLTHAERQGTLGEIRRVLRPGGLLLMSTHNRHFAPFISGPATVLTRNPLRVVANIANLGRRLRNRRRLRPLELQEDDYAVLNDEAHDFSLLHYYISPEAQERQLADHGFELLACLTLEGNRIARDESAARTSELHYAARATASGAGPAPPA